MLSTVLSTENRGLDWAFRCVSARAYPFLRPIWLFFGTLAGSQPPKRTCFCVSKGRFRVYLRTQICACYEARDFLVPTLTTFQRKRVLASSRRTWQYAYLFLRGGSPAACGFISTSLRPGLANSELSSLKPTREDAVCRGLVAPRSDPRTCFCG